MKKSKVQENVPTLIGFRAHCEMVHCMAEMKMCRNNFNELSMSSFLTIDFNASLTFFQSKFKINMSNILFHDKNEKKTLSHACGISVHKEENRTATATEIHHLCFSAFHKIIPINMPIKHLWRQNSFFMRRVLFIMKRKKRHLSLWHKN